MEVNKIRGFEVAKGWEDKSINLPIRQTSGAAGYDFEAAEDVVIEPLWKHLWSLFIKFLNGEPINDEILKPAIISTGVKAYMQKDEVLYLYNRSSNPLTNFLLLSNGVAVIDSDYYNNPKTDGEIQFQFINFGFLPKTIKKHQRIGQGVFAPFLKADNDNATGQRLGTSGSTGK